MSLEGVTVRRVNRHTGEVVEMTGEDEIMAGMAGILERGQAARDGDEDEAAVILQLYDEAVERVLAARKALALLKIQAKGATEEVALAQESLLYLRRRYQVMQDRAEAGDPEQLPLSDG